jgi:hypothetical protein
VAETHVSDAPGQRLIDVALDEFTGAVPRLISRTRRQVHVGRTIVARLPCLGVLAPPARPVSVPAHERVGVTVLDVLAADWDDGRTDVAPTPTPLEPVPSSEPVPDAADLPLQDYDALAASQVVPRLTSLSAPELDAVRRYERGHRNRQTILNRVGQLLAEQA